MASASRRFFLQQVSGACLAASAVPSLADSDEESSHDLVDAHVHVWTPDTLAYPLADSFKKTDQVPSSFTPEELFTHCKPAGISRVVLIQMSFYEFDNSYMLDCIEKYSPAFSGVAIVDSTRSDVAATMKKLAKRGVRGFRLYADRVKANAWATSDGIRAMWKCGADEGLAMCLLADPDALPAIAAMCNDYPKTPVVIDHFARIGMRGAVDQQQLDQLLALSKFPLTLVKTSAFYALGKKKAPYVDLGPMIRQLRDAYGTQRLLWGTDCPYQVSSVDQQHSYTDSVALLRNKIDFLSKQERREILRDTARRIFFSG